MKLLKTTTLKNGRKRITLELPAEEGKLLYIQNGGFFKLGYPLEDQVVESHHVQEVRRVAWDAYSQDWLDV